MFKISGEFFVFQPRHTECVRQSALLSVTKSNVDWSQKFYKHTQQWIWSKFLLKIPQHVKCLTTVIYDLPLITIPVSNCHLFSGVNISQGSVATRLRCGGIFSHLFTANLSLSLTMEEFWKSVKICQSYRHKFGGPVFWNTVYGVL